MLVLKVPSVYVLENPKPLPPGGKLYTPHGTFNTSATVAFGHDASQSCLPRKTGDTPVYPDPGNIPAQMLTRGAAGYTGDPLVSLEFAQRNSVSVRWHSPGPCFYLLLLFQGGWLGEGEKNKNMVFFGYVFTLLASLV